MAEIELATRAQVEARIPKVAGTLPGGIDWDTWRGQQYAGTWWVNPANAGENMPPEPASQFATLTVLPSSGGVSSVQIYVAHDRVWWRAAPGSVWGAWRRVATRDDVNALVNPKVLTAADDLDELPDGIYRVNFQGTASALGLPARVGRLTVMRVTDTIRLQKYETNFGEAVSEGVIQPYEVHIRGMNNAREWYPTFQKVFPVAGTENTQIQVSHTVFAESAVSRFDEENTFYEKNADVLLRPASTLKVLTGVIARTVVTDGMLDDLVTVTASDENPGGSGASIPLEPGDVVTFRDLFYLIMLPSHNQAAEILARAVGDLMPGAGTSREKFIAEMQAKASDWWGAGRVIANPTGLGATNKLTANDLTDLMYRVTDDAFLLECMGTEHYTVNVEGPNARDLSANHTVLRDGDVKFPDMVAAKSGTLTGHACLVMLFRNSDGSYGAAALMGSDTENRYKDMRQIINYAKEGPDRAFLVG